jgi:hypothetical protein
MSPENRAAPKAVEPPYGRRTVADADDDVAAAALVLGYPVQIQVEPKGTLFVMPDEQIIRQYQSASRCWGLFSLPLDRPTFHRAQERLRRVQTAMRIVGKQRELVAPPA